MYKLSIILVIFTLNVLTISIPRRDGVPLVVPSDFIPFNLPDQTDNPLPYGMTAWTGMTLAEAHVTFERYKDDGLVWDAPKGLLFGNMVGAKPPQKPNLYPDRSSTYIVANITMGDGWVLVLKGQFPHARYFCITVAKQLPNHQLGNGAFLRADQIIPDPGSENPFIPGGSRDYVNRNFTVYIRQGVAPNVTKPNTLYSNTTDDDKRIHISTRTYLVDVGYDGTGNIPLDGHGSGLLDVSLSLPNGDSITGEKLIDVLQVAKNGDPNGYSRLLWLETVGNSSDPVNAPAIRVPFFQLYWNNDYSVTGSFITDPETRVQLYPPSNSGGFASNADTKYMVSLFSFQFGDVVVITGTMPTHQVTRHGQSTLVESSQLQYFSVSTAAAPSSGEGYSTLSDEEIPIVNGTYTIVVAWPWNRPANANIYNGIGYLDPGAGEGHYVLARSWIGMVYIRFQNNNASWPESPVNVPMPSTRDPIPQEPFVMGNYCPKMKYTTVEDFESKYQNYSN